MTVLFT